MKYCIEKALQVLENTPHVLKQLLSGLDDEWVKNNEGGDSWSAYDIVGHLLHGEQTDWIPRIEITLSEGDNKTFTPFDRFAQFEKSKGKTLEGLLDEFAEARSNNIKVFKGLNITEDDLSKTATHPALGTVTLSNLLSAWVAHDLGHIAQISRVMAKQYKNAVGPWQEYMPILHDREKS